MIKKIILGSIFLFSLQNFAQDGTASPYSSSGIGETKFKGTIENRSMGSIGILNDSIHINLQNPASLSSLKLTTFTVAGTFTPTNFKTANKDEKAQRTNLDYLAMSFPAGKFSVLLGLMPYSAVGYKITQKVDGKDGFYTGNGNVNRFFSAIGYQITNKFSAGLELGYNFGKINRDINITDPTFQNGTAETNSATLSGLNFKLGVLYKTKIRKYDFINSLTFEPQSTLDSENTSRTGVFSAETGSAIFNDEVKSTNTLKLPSKLTFGSGIGVEKKWFVGFESSFLSKGNLDVNFKDETTYESSSKFALGGYYVPKYNSFSNYLDRITYRAGVRYENTGIVVRNESIKDRALTLGFGFPLSGSFSNINFGFELGKKGTTNNGLIQENYMNFSVGLSFNDRWFVKRKFD